MKKDLVRQEIKEVFGLKSINEVKEFEAKFDTLLENLGDKLEERAKGETTDKAEIGSKLVIDKRFVSGREGTMKGKAWKTEDSYTLKAKLK